MNNNDKTLLVSKHHEALRQFINNKVSNIDDANDILSSVYVKFVAQSKMPANPIAWLYFVTKNSIIDYYRTHKVHEDSVDDLIEEIENDDHFKEFSACMLPILNDMETSDRLPIQLVDIDGLKQQLAAKELNLSLAALKSRLLRARKKLQAKMAQCCPPVRNQLGEIEDFNRLNKECKNC